MYSHPNLVHWFSLRDHVRWRCEGHCEMCTVRRVAELHHRHYATFGGENPEDVMFLCYSCHKWVGGHKKLPGTYWPGSLLDLGDDGHGDSPIWQEYLKEAKARMKRLINERRSTDNHNRFFEEEWDRVFPNGFGVDE